MTTTFHKFNSFVGDFGTKKIDLNGDMLKVLLTDTAPDAGDTVVDTTTTTCTVKGVSNAAEIAAASGYTKGGLAIGSNAYSQSGGVGKLTGTKITVTAGAAIGPFRYAVLYDNSAGTSSTRPVIGWWDCGKEDTMGVGESFVIGNTNDGTDWTNSYPVLTVQ
jgi:hypothetical protein